MRWLVACMISLALVAPAQAQCRWNDGQCWYRAAESDFESLDVDTRLFFQLMLTASGYWNAVPNTGYSYRLHGAIQDFQASIGQSPTGYLTGSQIDQLGRIATPVIEGWDFRSIRHPDRKTLLWVPVGLGLYAERIADGVLVHDESNRFRLKYLFFASANLNAGYEATLAEMLRSGDDILFHVVRDDFFAISSHQGRYHRYVRYHRDGGGLIGFDMNWSTEVAPIYGQRLASVISGSLWATMTGAPHLSADVANLPWENERVASLPRQTMEPEPPRDPPPGMRPATPRAEAPEHGREASGTGFFVTRDGHVVTNSHVVDGCRQILVSTARQSELRATLLARDQREDLALVEIDASSDDVAGIRVGTRLGEPVAVFGYPLTGLLATSGNFTLGNITATAGLGDDPSKLQISAPVQPGNSGGPLLDENGNVVGVVVAKLNAIRTALATGGDIPQNVNFAIKGTSLAHFLATNNIGFESGTATTRMEPADLAEHARRMTVRVACQ